MNSSGTDTRAGTQQLTIYATPELIARLRDRAESASRSISNMACILLSDAMDRMDEAESP
jgi:hypothetical protein